METLIYYARPILLLLFVAFVAYLIIRKIQK